MKNMILSKRFSKFTRRFQRSARNDAEVGVNVDVWGVILLKVDPSNIFKCILVSKEWLDVITSSYFRKQYLRKWKGTREWISDVRRNVIGFMRIRGKFKLVATNSLGSRMNKTKLLKGSFEVLSKSTSGDGLLLCADPRAPDHMYVFDLASSETSVAVTPLPPPPLPSDSWFHKQIISLEDSSFKVVMVESRMDFFCHTVEFYRRIQTFCSSTWMWEQSKLNYSNSADFLLECPPMILSSKGVDYFSGKIGKWTNGSFALLALHTNNQTTRLIPVPIPLSNRNTAHYEVTPEGNLRCASTELGKITIWDLDPQHFEWNPSFIFNSGDTRSPSCFDYSHTFAFLSFVPGRPDSIFVEHISGSLFIYDPHTQLMDKFEGSLLRKIARYKHVFLPLTIVESGVWPKPPRSFKRI